MLIYVTLFIWMLLSLIAAMIINATFTIAWLRERNVETHRDIRLGHLSNFLKALDVAKREGSLPRALKWQQLFYLQALALLAVLLGLATLDRLQGVGVSF